MTWILVWRFPIKKRCTWNSLVEINRVNTMNKFRLYIVIVFGILLFSIVSFGYGNEKGKVLVLGFHSRVINNIQDRLLRENIMKRFLKRGYRIVPVMQIESFIQKKGYKNIRRIDHSHMRYLGDIKGADYTIGGTIAPEKKGAPHNKIGSNIVYICSVRIYHKKKNTFYNYSFKTKGKENLSLYFDHIAEVIVNKTRTVLE